MYARNNYMSISLVQSINQHYYETNTDVRGSFRIGKFILSGQIGVNAGEHRFTSDLVGVPDSIGLTDGQKQLYICKFLYQSEHLNIR